MSVPSELRDVIGKREIWRSLGNVSHKEAKALAGVESVKVDALFAEARGAAPAVSVRSSTLSDGEIAILVQRYLHGLEKTTEPAPFLEQDQQQRLENLWEDAHSISSNGLEDPSIQIVAKRVLADGGYRNHSGVDLFRMSAAVQRALLEHFKREEDRLQARMVGRYDPLFEQVDAKNAPVAPLTVSGAIQLYKDDPERANVAPKTRRAYEFRYRVLEELLGPDKKIAEVTRADIRAARDVLLKLPPNAQKRTPNKTLVQLAEEAHRSGTPPMSPKSATLYVEALSALFNWLVREELVERNPASAIKGPAVDEEPNRRSFTTDELRLLFNSEPFDGKAGKGWYYWLPRLALFSGARFAELLALRVVDIVEEDGVWCLSITPHEARRLKTKSSKRLVPIHPQILEAGFLGHVDEQDEAGLIFPDAEGPKDMVTARNKAMGRELRRIFPDKSLVFHGLRHTFKDAAERARIPRELISRIGGWSLESGNSAMDSYGRDRLLPVLYEELSRVTFGVQI
ncbi:integrase [Rhizobium rosettiformans]|nr:integrase [Rhizobium rosettiformans]MDR7063527.1 integrase [Rhizobium rosettiformans]